MKLTTDPTILAAAAAHAAKQLAHAPGIPVLQGVRLVADKRRGTFTVTAFDYETGTVHTLGTRELQTGGTALLPGRLFADVTAKLSRGDVVHLSTDKTHAVIECGRARFTLPLLPIADYPGLPELPPSSGLVDADQFAEAIAQVAPFTSTNAGTPHLQGVQLEVGEDALTLTATDTYRMAVRRLPWRCAADLEQTTVLIPARPMQDAAKAVAGDSALTDGSDVQLHLPGDDAGLVGLTSNNWRISTRLLEGKLPDYRTLLHDPDTVTCSVRVQGNVLAEAVARVAPVATRNQPVCLDIADGSITITGGTNDDGLGLDAVDAVLTGEPTKIAFNPKLLGEVLKQAGGSAPETQIDLVAPTARALIHPATGSDDPALRYVLMPVRTAQTAGKEDAASET
jgi:DNA polymerase III subunit beta